MSGVRSDEPNISDNSRLILDIGCGNEKQVEEAIGIDIVETDAVDIVVDVQGGIPFNENCVDEIYARMSFEHMDAKQMLSESRRVLKPGGELYLTVPHPFTTGFWQDWTHVVQPGFTVDGINYLAADHDMYYEHDIDAWKIKDINIGFWFNFTSLFGRAVSTIATKMSSFLSPKAREELLKLPFAGGWLKATLVKPRLSE